jgi:hypothetical protein
MAPRSWRREEETMTAYSLAEQELAIRISKLEEARGEEKTGGGSGVGALSARVKTVEGQLTELSARLDAIEGSETKPATKSTAAKK